MTPPIIRACILYQNTFLPRLRAASSSSRIDFSTRPHGLRMIKNTARLASATSTQPTVMTHICWPVKAKVPTP